LLTEAVIAVVDENAALLCIDSWCGRLSGIDSTLLSMLSIFSFMPLLPLQTCMKHNGFCWRRTAGKEIVYSTQPSFAPVLEALGSK